MCYLGLIGVELAQGKYKEAGQHSQEIQSIYQDVKEPGRSIMILGNLQISAWVRGDFEEAVRMGNQILDLIPESFLGYKAWAYYYLGRVALSQNNLDQTGTLIQMAILEKSFDILILQTLEGAAALFSQQGKRLQAVRLFGALNELYQPIRLSLPLREREENEEALASARSALGEEAFAAAWQEGQAMTLEQARVFALEELG